MARPSPDKLKVLWQKGRNYFASFFVELGGVRKEIGSDREFASWCIADLHIGLDALTHVSNVLKKTDAQIVKRDLADARATERADRARKRAQERQAREEERARAAIEKAQKKAQAQRERKQKRDRDYHKRKKEKQLALYAASVRAKSNGSNIVVRDESELANRIKQVQAQLLASREQWIEVSINLAGYLCQARKGRTDHEFSDWLERYDIHINKDDRAALLNLGTNLAAMREMLQQTERSSYRHIWREVQLRLSKE